MWTSVRPLFPILTILYLYTAAHIFPKGIYRSLNCCISPSLTRGLPNIVDDKIPPITRRGPDVLTVSDRDAITSE